MKKSACTLGVAALLTGCHTITEELPTQPTKPPSRMVLTIPIPTIPGATPAPTPKPSPTPTPSPTATPGPTPTPTPTAGKCGAPLPNVSRMNVKVHMRGPTRDTLDSTPIVGPDIDYCRQIGFDDGRSFCPVRPEGAPDRAACEEWAIGRADDTGRPGPTWYRNGQLCDGTYCENHPDNQYLLWAYVGGHYEACTKDDICGSVDSDR